MIENMNEMTTQIEKMRALGVEPNKQVTDAAVELSNPHYRIGFVGKFQTGKTHIINKVFLNDENLLAEGAGLCKTAVTVEIKHGGIRQFSYGSNGNQIEVITDPDQEAIARATAATDDDEREKLFQGVSNAVLFYPNDLLQSVSVCDTPGIDDPNEELLRETTYKLLPELDMTVMVVAPKALSQPELRFLQKRVFACGIGRFMMLVSCKPMDQCEPEDEELLRNQILKQLHSIGRDNIPIYFYREDEDGKPVTGNKPIADEIIENAKAFTLSNRCGRLRRAMAAQLSEEIARLTITCGVYGKDHAELADMKSEAIRALNELLQCMDDLQNEFSIRLSLYGTRCVHGFEADVRKAQDQFIARLDDADGLGKAQEMLNHADTELQQTMEDSIVTRMHEFYSEARKLADEMVVDLQKRWQETVCPLMLQEVDGGFIQNWNTLLITLGDYILSGWLLPGGFLFSIGLRWILGKIPMIKELMPTNLAKEYMVRVARESLSQQMSQLVDEFALYIADEEKKICKFLAEAKQKEIDRQQSLLDAISDKEKQSDAAFDIIKVRDKINELGNLLKQLA